MFGKKKVKRVDKHRSIAFWLAIPSTFFLGGIALIASITLTSNHVFQHEVWAMFLIGLLAGMVSWVILPLQRTKVFLHELKHALMVIFVGGTLKGMRVRRDGGSVSYEMPEALDYHGPTIVLAPYCFPLLSIPVFILACFFQEGRRLLFAVFLGWTLGSDLVLCLEEVRPVQSDFKKVIGGFLFSALYIAGWLFLWSNLCVLWVVGGRDALWYGILLGLQAVESLIPLKAQATLHELRP